jgi:zinc transport system substrate-binding protein
MQNHKTKLFFPLLLLLSIFITACTQEQKPQEQKPIVALSTFSLYDITKHIAGDSVTLINILPFGVDPHSFEPTPRLMASIEKSTIVFYSGAGLEPWTHGYTFKNKSINMSQYVSLRTLQKGHQHHDGDAHSSSKTDPHYWLDFQNMQKAVDVITKELIEIAPQNKALYEKNREKYRAMLQNLQKLYSDDLQSCELDTIIVNHNAFGYLSHNFNFKVKGLSGLVPEAQPNAKKMAHLIEEIQHYKVPVIFGESFVSSKAMQSIAAEVGVKVETLQPLGNITADEAKQNLTYEDIMKKNLQKIRKALKCH